MVCQFPARTPGLKAIQAAPHAELLNVLKTILKRADSPQTSDFHPEGPPVKSPGQNCKLTLTAPGFKGVGHQKDRGALRMILVLHLALSAKEEFIRTQCIRHTEIDHLHTEITSAKAKNLIGGSKLVRITAQPVADIGPVAHPAALGVFGEQRDGIFEGCEFPQKPVAHKVSDFEQKLAGT